VVSVSVIAARCARQSYVLNSFSAVKECWPPILPPILADIRQKLDRERFYFALILVALCLQDITNGDDARYFPFLHNGKVTDAFFDHGMRNRTQVVMWTANDHFSRHHVAHRQREDVFIDSRTTDDVALRDNPNTVQF